MIVKFLNFSESTYYIAKLRREIDRIEKAQASILNDDIKDHSINAAITAWHLPEWVIIEKYPKKEKREIKTETKLLRQTLIDINPDYALMHDIATQAKHLRVSEPQSPASFDVRASASINYTEQEKQLLFTTSFEESPYIRLTNPIQQILKIDGRNALAIFEEIYNLLDTQLITYQSNSELT